MAEPRTDLPGDGDVAVPAGFWQHEVEPGPGEPGSGQNPGPRECDEVTGHTHELAARQRAQRAARPDGSGGSAGAHQLTGQAHRIHQVDAFGPAGEHRLCSLVDRHARELGHGELAADPGRALEQRHPHRRVAQEEGRGQARDPAAHDDDMRRGTARRRSLARTCGIVRLGQPGPGPSITATGQCHCMSSRMSARSPRRFP